MTFAIGRRTLPLVGLAAAIAPARAETGDLAVSCDTTLAPALRRAGAAYAARSGVRVFVFPTGPGLILPQLERDIQNDIVVTQVLTLERAASAGIVASAPTVPRWRNSLVIAGPRQGSSIDQTIAASDATPASDIDGPAVLARLGLKPARVLGAVDTDEVVALLLAGEAQAGLLHMTDVRANPSLDIIRPVSGDVQPPLIYAASVTRLARRPNPEGFVAFLGTSAGAAVLTESGLEKVA
jgi:molybdate transport system substrate-binding protein